jgi:hypothetical protein
MIRVTAIPFPPTDTPERRQGMLCFYRHEMTGALILRIPRWDAERENVIDCDHSLPEETGRRLLAELSDALS